MSRVEIKAEARAMLGSGIFADGWLMALLVCLIAQVICAAAGTIVPGIGAVLVMGPIYCGLSGVFLNRRRTARSIKVGDMFGGFNDFGQTFLLGLLVSLFTALWSLLFVVPGIVKFYSYSQAYNIKADHPDYDWRACINASKEMMRGHKAELFVLDLSFLGWYILGALCLGFGTLWVYPYHFAARTVFYDKLKGETDFGGTGSDWYQKM